MLLLFVDFCLFQINYTFKKRTRQFYSSRKGLKLDTFVFSHKGMQPGTLVFAKTHRICACILFSAGDEWDKECRMKKWKRNDLLYLKRKIFL